MPYNLDRICKGKRNLVFGLWIYFNLRITLLSIVEAWNRDRLSNIQWNIRLKSMTARLLRTARNEDLKLMLGIIREGNCNWVGSLCNKYINFHCLRFWKQ